MQTTDCGIIILAAGNSSRLGKAKQLLPYQNKTLLQHTIDEATASNATNIIVVTGAYHKDILSRINFSFVKNIYNNNWQQGMATSMQAGLSALLADDPQLSSVIIMLCDQPFVTSQLLNEITEAKQSSGKGIVACVYKNTAGVPALFDKKYFHQLLSLTGSEGAKKMIMMNGNDVAAIDFPLGEIDIDTMHDYEQWQKKLSERNSK